MARPAIDHETRLSSDDHMALRLWLRLLTCANLIETTIRRRLQQDFELTRLDDPKRLEAFVKATADELWLSHGREDLMRNVPELWEAGTKTLSHAGMITNTDPTIYYDNTYVDEALKA